MSVGDGLRENGIMGHEIPVDLMERESVVAKNLYAVSACSVTYIFEVLLLQNGEEKPCHLVVGAGHGGCKCCESIWGCR